MVSSVNLTEAKTLIKVETKENKNQTILLNNDDQYRYARVVDHKGSSSAYQGPPEHTTELGKGRENPSSPHRIPAGPKISKTNHLAVVPNYSLHRIAMFCRL